MGSASAFGFMSTAAATLIGVFIAFLLESRRQTSNRRETSVQHLKSIKRELKNNSKIAEGNYKVITELQRNGNDASHYVLDVCSTSEWEAALSANLIEFVDSSLYEDLQSAYSDIQSLNEMVARLRTEPLHPEVSEDRTNKLLEFDTWTLSVLYWDASQDEVMQSGLGDIIKRRSNETRVKINGIIEDIEDEIESIES